MECGNTLQKIPPSAALISFDDAHFHFPADLRTDVDGNVQATKRLYRIRYPQRDGPNHLMFPKLHHNLWEYGSLPGNRHGGAMKDSNSQHRTRIALMVSHKFCSMHGAKRVDITARWNAWTAFPMLITS
ncbi:hypothetical protein TNCV_825051 [Trichonephila clavipes]|nr:hypothetical protein TNCV_825051 [Trichonephila clavipes]